LNEGPTTSPAPLIIEAGRTERHYWRDLWRYRELLGFLAWRDVKVRYKQAVLGVAWAVVQPAVETVLLTFVFGKLAKMSGGNVPYPLLVLAGLLPWQLFSGAFSGAGNSLVSNAHLISKIYFPRLLVPLSAVVVAMIDMLLLLVIAMPYAMYHGINPSWHLLLLPLFALGTMLVALGTGLWITALTVKYHSSCASAYSSPPWASARTCCQTGATGSRSIRSPAWSKASAGACSVAELTSTCKASGSRSP